MAAPVVLVSGTDTGIGKTFVSCGLVRALTAAGKRVGAMKLVESGIAPDSPDSDAHALWSAANASQTLEEVCPFSFAEPASPNVAARAAGKSISFEAAANALNSLPADADLNLVEGAGGLLVPINDNFTFADFAQELGIPVLLVVGSRLGAINHASLSFEVLAARGIKTIGYVLNEYGADGKQQYSLALETNREEIFRAASRFEIPELGCVPYAASEGDASIFDKIAGEILRRLGGAK
ncbi:MAG: dethiobiotin synthase [Bdellovibrionales bacterium]|nr:dethiobiotin synthase [Bdellovibrionales bacterium]